jgi:hypothetical protein
MNREVVCQILVTVLVRGKRGQEKGDGSILLTWEVRIGRIEICQE